MALSRTGGTQLPAATCPPGEKPVWVHGYSPPARGGQADGPEGAPMALKGLCPAQGTFITSATVSSLSRPALKASVACMMACAVCAAVLPPSPATKPRSRSSPYR
jgi:hypothetical protein